MKVNLSYLDAIELANKLEWEVSTCDQGESCWCRIISVKGGLFDRDDEEIYIVGSGAMMSSHANHIVDVHNKSILI